MNLQEKAISLDLLIAIQHYSPLLVLALFATICH